MTKKEIKDRFDIETEMNNRALLLRKQYEIYKQLETIEREVKRDNNILLIISWILIVTVFTIFAIIINSSIESGDLRVIISLIIGGLGGWIATKYVQDNWR